MKKFILTVAFVFAFTLTAFAQAENVNVRFIAGNTFDGGVGKIFGVEAGANYDLLTSASGNQKLKAVGNFSVYRETDNSDYGIAANAKLRAFPCKYFFVEGGVVKVSSEAFDYSRFNYVAGGGVQVNPSLVFGYNHTFRDNTNTFAVTSEKVFTEAYLPLAGKFKIALSGDFDYDKFKTSYPFYATDRARGFKVGVGLARFFRN